MRMESISQYIPSVMESAYYLCFNNGWNGWGDRYDGNRHLIE